MNDPDRNISMSQLMTVLSEGSIVDGPTRDECGDLRCKLKKRAAGRRVYVVVAISAHDMLYVITTF